MTPTSQCPEREIASGRSPTPTFERLLIVGLDGVTWDVLRPLMDAGRLPRLRTLVEQGASGVLQSTVPPITPAAWTTFLTGKNPGRHGIIDFERYDPLTNKLAFNSTFNVDHVRTLWRILGDKGLRVGSVNVPLTYPARAVNGFMVSGFETPGTDSDFVFPPALKSEILSRFPDPTLRAKWRGRFEENLKYISRSFRQGAEMTQWLGDRHGWDALMVVFKLTDNLQHKTWKYLDPRWSDRAPGRRDAAVRCFSDADEALGTLVDYAKSMNAGVMVVSDHGHGSLEGKIQVNLLLEQWGYLSVDAASQKFTRVRRLWDRMLGRTRKFARPGDVLHDLAVDFSRTRACVMHAGMAGFLYVNLKGRQPTGIVEPGEYEALRDEIRGRLLGEECHVVTPNGQRVPMFTAVHKTEQLYGCSREDQPWLPDLMLIPYSSLAVVRKIRGRRAVRWLPYSRLEGTHRPEGIIALAGPGVVHGKTIDGNIADCTPTALALLGIPVPDDMDGRVLAEVFEKMPQVRFEAAPSVGQTAAHKDVYSEGELAQVTERLSQLGYLE